MVNFMVPVWAPGPYLPMHIPYGPQAAYGEISPHGICTPGLVRAARTGPAQIHMQAWSNPGRYPDWARTGQTGLANQIP